MKLMLVICSLFGLLLVSRELCQARVDISPRLLLREEYNDNIFLDASGEETDFITTAAPGLTINLDRDPVQLALDYSLEFRKYQDHSDQDETSLRDIQRGLALARILPGRDFSVDLTQEFSRVPIDTRLPFTATNSRVNKTTLSRSVVRPRFRHRFSPTLELLLDYQYENWNYQSPRVDDREAQSGRLGLIHKVSPRLEVLLGGHGGIYNADVTTDYNLAAAYAGFSARVLPTLNLDLVAGEAWLDFASRDDRQSLIGDVLARLALSPNLSVALGGSEDFRFSADFGVFRRKLVRALAGWNNQTERYPGSGLYSWHGNYPSPGDDPLVRLLAVTPGNRSFWELTLYTQRDDYYDLPRQDRETGLLLTSGLQLAEDWDLLAAGSVARLKFQPQTETVDRFEGDLGIEYRLGVVTLAAHYLYREDDSDLNSNDFRNHVGYLEARLAF